MADFVIPELGEGVAGGDVVRVLVKPGDTLKKDQPVLELETDKATIEVPSSVAGVVKELKVKTGDKVKVGQVVLTVDESGPRRLRLRSGQGACGRQLRRTRPRPRPRARRGEAGRPGSRQARGSGRRRAAAGRRRAHRAVQGRGHRARRRLRVQPRLRRRPALPLPSGGGLVPAAPSTRRTARELGVDITQVEGSGPGGRISVDDVKGYARSVLTGGGGGLVAGVGRPAAGLHPVGRGRSAADAQHPARHGRAAVGGVGHHPARHAVRQVRHHRAGEAPAEVREDGGEGRRQAHHHRHRAEGHRRRRSRSSRSSTAPSTWPASRSCSRSTCTSASPSTPIAA